MTTQTETTKKEFPRYTVSMDEAPKDGSWIMAWGRGDQGLVAVQFDSAWGGGRGAWFTDKNKVVTPLFWNPEATKVKFGKQHDLVEA